MTTIFLPLFSGRLREIASARALSNLARTRAREREGQVKIGALSLSLSLRFSRKRERERERRGRVALGARASRRSLQLAWRRPRRCRRTCPPAWPAPGEEEERCVSPRISCFEFPVSQNDDGSCYIKSRETRARVRSSSIDRPHTRHQSPPTLSKFNSIESDAAAGPSRAPCRSSRPS